MMMTYRVLYKHPPIFNVNNEHDDKSIKGHLVRSIANKIYYDDNTKKLVEKDEGEVKHTYKIDCCIVKTSEMKELINLIEMFMNGNFMESNRDDLLIRIRDLKDSINTSS